MRTRSVIAAVAVMVVLAGAAAAFALLRPTGAGAAPTASPISLTIQGLTPAGQPIAVESYSWGLQNLVGIQAKLDLQNLHVVKELDTLSPDIVQAVKSEQGFASATLIVITNPGSPNQATFQYDLTGVTIESDQQSGANGAGAASEQLSIHASSVDLHTVAG